MIYDLSDLLQIEAYIAPRHRGRPWLTIVGDMFPALFSLYMEDCPVPREVWEPYLDMRSRVLRRYYLAGNRSGRRRGLLIDNLISDLTGMPSDEKDQILNYLAFPDSD